MASTEAVLSEEHFMCSMCLAVFSSPVSTPCGHSFCVTCISAYWDSSKICKCPKCEKVFPVRPELCENRFARDMAEQLGNMKISPSDGLSGPGDVPCDICPIRKLRALKSCLVCLASYCEVHLEPHLRVATLKRHKLVEPVENIEDRMCVKHERFLELFCRSDQMCVCVLCTESDHKGHNTVPVEREWMEKKTQLETKRAEILKMIQDRFNKVEEIKQSMYLGKINTEQELEDSVRVFTDLIRSIERSKAELIEEMEEKQRAAERRAEGLIKELEQEIGELQRRNTELEQLFDTEDHIYFLQSFPSIHDIPSTKDWSGVTVYTDLCASTLRRAISRLETLLKMEETKCCERELKTISQYAVDVTLDPKTANSWLVLSEDGKQVRDGDTEQHLPDNPERFDTAPLVLGKERFSSGRHYWEVEVANKVAWDLGVARESIKRKGMVRLSPEDGYWTVCLRRPNEYRACASKAILLPLSDKPRKVGLYVDYEAGQVSFYNVEAHTHMHTFDGCMFAGKILPVLNPDMNDNGDNSKPLVISCVSNRKDSLTL